MLQLCSCHQSCLNSFARVLCVIPLDFRENLPVTDCFHRCSCKSYKPELYNDLLLEMDLQLLCSRATFYFANDLNFSDAGGSSDDAPFDLNRWKAGFGRINEAMKMKMFYV